MFLHPPVALLFTSANLDSPHGVYYVPELMHHSGPHCRGASQRRVDLAETLVHRLPIFFPAGGLGRLGRRRSLLAVIVDTPHKLKWNCSSAALFQ